LIEVDLNGSKNGGLWVLEGLGGFSSSGLVSGDILIRDGIGSNIWEGRDELGVVWVVGVVSHGREGSSLGGGDEKGNGGGCQEFHYLI
jgi:hypothetical protein